MTRGIDVEANFGINDNPKSLHYLRQISESIETNFFLCSFGGVLLKDCKDDGDLLSFKSINEFENLKKLGSLSTLWLYLRLKVFFCNERDIGLYGIFVCPKCPTMSAIEEMGSIQDPEALKLLLCLHSRVANFLVKDWRPEWNLRQAFKIKRGKTWTWSNQACKHGGSVY